MSLESAFGCEEEEQRHDKTICCTLRSHPILDRWRLATRSFTFHEGVCNLTGLWVRATTGAYSFKVTWEYRILLGYTSQLASLESSINAFAEQGYTVESFQPVSSVSGGRAQGADSYFEVNSTTQVFVLLRRIRR